MAEKRKLPVIQSRPEDQEPPRPPAHWVGFGIVAVLALWLPLAAVAQFAARRVVVGTIGDRSSEAEVEIALASIGDAERARLHAWLVALPIAALALAALGGGYLIGRYGHMTGAREGALAAALAALVAGLLASVGGAALGGTVVSVIVAALFGAVGAHLGKKRRG